jgi:hypothetical protein
VTAAELGRANAAAVERLCAAEPVLVDIRPAGEVVPGMDARTILTSGAPLPWDAYHDGQRSAILGGALFEGMAKDPAEAEERIRSGDIRVSPCHDHGCVGSLAGIYTASMPVFVVENRAAGTGNRSFCNLYEGPSHQRLNYGVYNEEVRRNLVFVAEVVARVLGEAVRQAGGVPLRPIMRRALHMGDELHSRNTAATLLFTRELFPQLAQLAQRWPDPFEQTLDYLRQSDYFFLRLSMASSKLAGDAAHGIESSSIVSAMTFSCREFSIRVSGLGDQWFSAPIPMVEAKLFEGYSEADISYMGGESVINETAGLGGFAQAAAFALIEYSGGTSERMVERNQAMYAITAGEHPEFKIPYFNFRGTPVGIEVFKVVETGTTPVMNIGVAHKDGGQIGAGVLTAPLECFQQAAAAHRERYGDGPLE